jgi:light-regulated signal transduction histidine kinase (bacteriophytochrome)
LRAPLRSINGFSQVLLEDYADKLDEEGRDCLSRVRAASERLARFIDELLDLSRMTRSEMSHERVDLSALVRDFAKELERSDPERAVEFVLQDGIVAEGDQRLLRVVLENLLRNAWKFTGSQPRARVEFGLTVLDGTPTYFVRDNGVGFDMAYAGKLFGAFQRLHRTSEFPGTGIGLATVQRIVRRHGGSVWAEGAVGQGATFYFTL